MAKFVKFTDAEVPIGSATQDVFVNPDHVRVVRTGVAGAVIELDSQRVSVREAVANVIQDLS
jgi:hypothetical protein